jgi:tryptophan-rich sensory protein
MFAKLAQDLNSSRTKYGKKDMISWLTKLILGLVWTPLGVKSKKFARACSPRPTLKLLFASSAAQQEKIH